MILHPKVSLIATILNEAPNIGPFLRSVAKQSRPPDEIIFTDGGSSDGTLRILHEWRPPEGIQVSIIDAPGTNIAAGRNVALARATGDVIAVSDAGTVLQPVWLESLLDAIAGGADVASGFFEPGGDSYWEREIGSVTLPLLSEIEPARFLPSSRSIAFRRSVLDLVGGYPEWADYCEDLIFDLNLKRCNANFRFVPTARVTWLARNSLRSFAKQYFHYAFGDAVAGLWPIRHAVRYITYSALVWSILAGHSRRHRTVRLLASAILSLHCRSHLRRAWARRRLIGGSPTRIMLHAVLIVLVGDVSKMAGYVAGRCDSLLQKMRNRSAP